MSKEQDDLADDTDKAREAAKAANWNKHVQVLLVAPQGSQGM